MYTDTHTILVAVGMRKMIAFSLATDGTLPVSSRSEYLTKNKMLISFTYLSEQYVRIAIARQNHR